jgi:hypothetical protein
VGRSGRHRLYGADGMPVSRRSTCSFAVYDGPAATTPIWSEAVSVTSVYYHQTPFVFKVASATADVRFRVYNPANGAATLTDAPGSCSHFLYGRIGP